VKSNRYGFTTTLTGLSFDDALARTTAALKTEGFGVLSDTDVQRAMKEKLGVDMPPYRILGVDCRPTRTTADRHPMLALCGTKPTLR